MKVLYLEAKNKQVSNINTSVLSKLPKQLYIVYSIQYKELAENIKQYLSKTHKIKGFSQVLGCSDLKTPYPVLLIGSGKFHALNLALQNTSPIYIYTGSKIEQLDKGELEKYKKQKQVALSKFILANKIGLLVSTKPGQEQLHLANRLKTKLEKQGKKAYLFMSNNINLSELENFKIDSWINTACPGLAYDTPKILNIKDLSNIK